MRICFDYQCFVDQRAGGISRYITRLATELSLLNQDCAIYAGLHRNIYINAPVCLGRLKVKGVGPFPCLPFTGKIVKGLNYAIWRSLSARLTAPYDIVHPTYYRTFDFSPRSKVVYTLHDFVHERHGSGFRDCAHQIKEKRRALEKANLIIAVSHSTKNDLVEFYPQLADKCVVVHHGVDSSSHKWRPNLSGKFLLYIGQRDGYKNFELLWKLFSYFPDIRNTYSLVCFGGGPLKKCEMVPGANFSWKSGDDFELTELLSQASALIYPSIYEGFGLPILEAYAVGCPVFCAKGSSITEVAGSVGFFIDSSDPESLRDQILRMDVEALTANQDKRVQVASNFSWKKCSEETLLSYKRI